MNIRYINLYRYYDPDDRWPVTYASDPYLTAVDAKANRAGDEFEQTGKGLRFLRCVEVEWGDDE